VRIVGIALLIILSFSMNAWALYDNNYLVYDEYGLKQVNCMRCNVVVKERVLRLSRVKDDEPIYIESVKSLSNFTAVPVELDNGSWTNILMCKDCKKEYQLTDEEKVGMANQLKGGWVEEARGLRRSQKEIKAIAKRVKKTKVVKKHRFKKRLKGIHPKRKYKVKRRSKLKRRK
jgi:hypothetical protein